MSLTCRIEPDDEAVAAPDFSRMRSHCTEEHGVHDPFGSPFSSFLDREQVATRSVNPPLEKTEERTMPVLLLWAVPAVIVIGGAGYWIVHMH